MFNVGAASVCITPPIGGLLSGYAARKDVSIGVHDDLFARCLVVGDGHTEVAIITCDLIGLDKEIVAEVRERVTKQTGLPTSNLMICCTHTHSGPDGLRKGITGFDASLREITIRKLASLVNLARSQCEPCKMKIGFMDVHTLSQNRRDPDWGILPRLTVLIAENESGDIKAILINFACHGTVLGSKNLYISADYPGAVVGVIQAVMGENVTVLFTNGACADINPARRTPSFKEIERFGLVLGGEVLRLAGDLLALGDRVAADNIRWGEAIEKKIDAGHLIKDGKLWVGSRHVQLKLKEPLSSDEDYKHKLQELRKELEALKACGASLDKIREQMAKITALEAESYFAPRVRNLRESGEEYLSCELQVIGFDDETAIIGLPGEIAHDIGKELINHGGFSYLTICGYSNDYAGYIVTDRTYLEGGYEAGATPFAPGTEDAFVKAALDLLGDCRKREGNG
ncbi:MAG TPA: hypothetical protein GX509_07460 [Firmicutes bacterium]|nr:hypothetical protein [Bacillota bacterium]HHY98560.1 hypothetical protein [Bacillota bacterium]